MRNILFFDSTLRDGSHAVEQQLYSDQIEKYCSLIDGSGLYTVIVGHGNGLGASSIQMGRSAMPELDMLAVAQRNLDKTRLGTFVTVGFGTIDDHIVPAIERGVQLFCIACHATESDIMKKHIEYLSKRGKEVYGVLMNCHLTNKESLLIQAKNIEEYGADGVVLMDSAGTLTPSMVEDIVGFLVSGVDIRIGFHAHNNLSMAVANAYAALHAGATIIDGTVLGFGAGAGNCQLEAIVALLEKEGEETGVNLYQIMDAGDYVIRKMLGYEKGIDSISVISGYAGVVSTFKPRVIYISNKYGVDPRDVFIELGKRKAISGQDDLILEVAKMIKKERGGLQYGNKWTEI